MTDRPEIDRGRYPLHVIRCDHCGHVQLKETLDASFYGEYLYTPAYAGGFADYIEKFVKALSSQTPKPDRKVIEIGSSNGFLGSSQKVGDRH